MSDPKRKPKMIQAWKRERLDTRIRSAIQLLYFYGLITDRENLRARSRFIKAVERGEFNG